MRLGIIGGNGWIGGAIARAAVGAGLVAANDLTLSCRSAPPGWLPHAHWTRDNQALADRSDAIVLSVRPQDWPAIRVSAPAKLVVSVLAGVRLDDIASRLGTGRVVRALPNAAAEVGQPYTPWTATAAVTDADRATVRRLIDTFGTGDEVATEAEIDYMTGLSGTGPAYPALLAAAMMRDAVAHGLPPDVARRSPGGHRPALREDGRGPRGHRGGLRRLPRRHRRRDRDDAGVRLRRRSLGGSRRGAGEVAGPERGPIGDANAARCRSPVLHRRRARRLRRGRPRPGSARLARTDRHRPGHAGAAAGAAGQPAAGLRPSRRRAGDRAGARLAAFRTIEPDLEWARRASHDETASANFVDGHANAMILGPAGLENRRDVWLGASLIAPHVRYTDHSHAPEETFLVLSDGEFRQGDGAWFTPGVGGAFYNPPFIAPRDALERGAALRVLGPVGRFRPPEPAQRTSGTSSGVIESGPPKRGRVPFHA